MLLCCVHRHGVRCGCECAPTTCTCAFFLHFFFPDCFASFLTRTRSQLNPEGYLVYHTFLKVPCLIMMLLLAMCILSDFCAFITWRERRSLAHREKRVFYLTAASCAMPLFVTLVCWLERGEERGFALVCMCISWNPMLSFSFFFSTLITIISLDTPFFADILEYKEGTIEDGRPVAFLFARKKKTVPSSWQ